MDFFEVFGGLLAGLGLFFVGIKTLTTNLKELTGRRFRRFLERSTRYPLLSALGGALLGATMQTGSAITFVLVGMVGAGMISVERSLPIRLGAAVGTSTMVFIATMDIRLFILFVLGIAGFAVAQSRSPRPMLGVLFGGGLMFFGLSMVGTTASSISEIDLFQQIIAGVSGAPVAAFLVAGLLSILIQSPQSVAILAIALATSGVLDSWTTIVIIYGSNFGGGLSTYFLSAGFKGTSRQIMIFQVLFNVLTGTVLLGLFFVERHGGVPLVHALVGSINTGFAQQMAFVYLIFNVFGAGMMYVLRKPLLSVIERRWPPSAEENIARLEYLHDHAIDTPDLALDLAEKEHQRFLSMLPMYLEASRKGGREGESDVDMLTRSLGQRHQSIEEVLNDLSHFVSSASSERLINLVSMNHHLGALNASLAAFSAAAIAAGSRERLSQLAIVVIEAFDFLLCTASDGVTERDLDELRAVWSATDDKSEKMRSIRKEFLEGGELLEGEERLELMAVTTGLERASWVLHELLEHEISRLDGDGIDALR
jgi:phosphate:Na+ symporter